MAEEPKVQYHTPSYANIELQTTSRSNPDFLIYIPLP